jgi:hypothetical protein
LWLLVAAEVQPFSEVMVVVVVGQAGLELALVCQ